jgi:hypothetical protein
MVEILAKSVVCYLLIGVVVLVAGRLVGLVQGGGGDRSNLVQIFLVPLWPFALVLMFDEVLRQRRIPTSGSEQEHFKILRVHLGQQMSLEEVERIEMIFDPLGAVPRAPFGHLNGTWQAFRTNLPEGAVLWSFEAPYEVGSWRRLRRGYVVEHEGSLCPSFIASERLLD